MPQRLPRVSLFGADKILSGRGPRQRDTSWRPGHARQGLISWTDPAAVLLSRWNLRLMIIAESVRQRRRLPTRQSFL